MSLVASDEKASPGNSCCWNRPNDRLHGHHDHETHIHQGETDSTLKIQTSKFELEWKTSTCNPFGLLITLFNTFSYHNNNYDNLTSSYIQL